MPTGGGTLGSPVYPLRPRPPSSLQEHTLSFIIGYDPITLREKVDLLAAGARLAELGNLRSLAALNEKVALLRLVGRLDEAWEIANEALRQSRFTGNREQAVASRIRRAQVLQFQGKLEEAASELTHCILDSEVHEWTRLAAYARQHRGKVYFDQGNLDGALADFTAAVFLREKDGADADELDSSLLAVAVVESHIAARSPQA
jgi:tetratricopeptide (TPR) repeat protein